MERKPVITIQKILLMPSGYAHGIMGDSTNARFGLL
jgi:hypothetical protein